MLYETIELLFVTLYHMCIFSKQLHYVQNEITLQKHRQISLLCAVFVCRFIQLLFTPWHKRYL